MTANIRTPQRTVSAMQRFAVSQKNHAEAITISPFLLSLPYRTENRRFSALSCTKNRRHPTEVECRLFCCPILLGRCRFCSFLKLLSYRHTPKALFFALLLNSRRKSERFHFGALLLNFLRKFERFHFGTLLLNFLRKFERFHFGTLLLNFLRKFNHFRTSLPASPTSPDILSGKSHIPSEMPGKKRNNPEIQTPGRRS